MDGMPVQAMISSVLSSVAKDATSLRGAGFSTRPGQSALSSASSSSLSQPEELTFQLGPETRALLSRACVDGDALVARHHLSSVSFHGAGSAQIKSFKMSPDAFAQLALQLAYKVGLSSL